MLLFALLNSLSGGGETSRGCQAVMKHVADCEQWLAHSQPQKCGWHMASLRHGADKSG